MHYQLRLAPIAFTIAMDAGCPPKHAATFNMTWSYGQTDPTFNDARNIVLHFVDHPHYHYGIHSRDLGTYLESLHSGRVVVTFNIYRGPRQSCGLKPVRVGERTRWDSQFEYYGYHSWVDSGAVDNDHDPCQGAIQSQ